MMKKALVALAFSGVAMSAQADVMLQEGFENVFSLPGKGWVLNNASTPAGLTSGWTQGDPAQFSAQQGSSTSFAAANYNNAAAGGMLNNWLITPEFTTTWGNTITFWLHGAVDSSYSDQIAYGVSSGSSALTDFTMISAVTVPQGEWTQYTFTVDAREGKGRFAIQYTGAADLANYVGVDSLVVNDIPEPSTMLILAAGVMGLTMSRRRKRG